MKKIFILFLLAQVACLSIAKAQTSVASPYSGYGLGDQIPYAGTHIQGMAQATTALSFTNAINVYNPASYSSLLYTTLDGGAFHNTIKITDGVQKQTNYATSFSHILLGFPVSKHWGAVIGLVPFTGTGYNIKQKEYQQGVGTVNHIYQGSGNISQIVFGNAVKLGNHFSVGLNMNYMFGNQTYIKKNEYDSTNTLNVKQQNILHINSFTTQLGVNYSFETVEKGKVTLGATAALGSNLSASNDVHTERYVTNSLGDVSVVDTVQNDKGKKGNIYLPTRYGFGIAYEKPNRLVAAMDVKYENWSKFTRFGENPGYQNSLRYSIGVQIMPKNNALSGYFSFIEYRFGLFSERGYFIINNQSINKIGATVGLGLPLVKNNSKFQLAFELSQRGSEQNNLLKETYYGLKIGFTFNDRWFIRSKFD